MERVRALGRPYVITELDGVRVELPEGWLLARKSVTEEVMTFRMEGKDEEGLDFIKLFLCRALPQLKEDIKCLP